MNRLLILLCMVGWALYIVHANSNKGGDLAAHNTAYARPSPAAQTPAPSTQSELRPVAPAAMQSPHAITPDDTPPQTAANVAAPPAQQTEVTQNPKPLPEPPQDPALQPGASQQVEEQLRVTSDTRIRSAPSPSAQVIGTAHAGATLRVKSRDSGWVQFVDPVAQQSGWISLAYLAPADRNAEMQAAIPRQSKKQTAIPRQSKKQTKAAKLKTPNAIPRVRQPAPSYAELPGDQEFVSQRRRGVFGLFWRRRLSDLPPPPYP
jgi:hypothetical protein